MTVTHSEGVAGNIVKTVKYTNGGHVHIELLRGATICNNVDRIDEDQMHKAIIEFFQSICGNKEDIAKQVRNYIGKELKRRYEHNFNRKELLTEVKNLETKRNRLVDLYSDGGISKDYLNDKLRPVSSRIDEINAALNVYANYENIGIDIEKSVTDFNKRIEAKSDSLLSNVFLKKIFEKFLVHEDGKIIAVLKIDYDTGLSIDIPFCEMVDDCKKQTFRNTTTVHKDVTERLNKVKPDLADHVRIVLEENKAERYIRGGEATKAKYQGGNAKAV